MYKMYNQKFQKDMVTIYAGEYYISCNGEGISTILGSCIAVCLYDEETGIGGMNHFMLPSSSSFNQEDPYRYGDRSIDTLISSLENEGVDRNNLKAKIFGGGNVMYCKDDNNTIGSINIHFAKKHLEDLGIQIVNEDVGTNTGRTITFLPHSSEVYVKRIPMSNVV